MTGINVDEFLANLAQSFGPSLDEKLQGIRSTYLTASNIAPNTDRADYDAAVKQVMDDFCTKHPFAGEVRAGTHSFGEIADLAEAHYGSAWKFLHPRKDAEFDAQLTDMALILWGMGGSAASTAFMTNAMQTRREYRLMDRTAGAFKTTGVVAAIMGSYIGAMNYLSHTNNVGLYILAGATMAGAVALECFGVRANLKSYENTLSLLRQCAQKSDEFLRTPYSLDAPVQQESGN
jgi:hypothetical protein